MNAEQIKLMIAAFSIDRLHVLYLRTKNPIHAWNAYRTARTLNVAIPAWVLDCFDAWASVLTTSTHTSATALADALNLVKRSGGRLATRQAENDVRDLEIVSDVLYLQERPTRDELKAMKRTYGFSGDVVDPGDRNITEIMEQVADERGLDYTSISKICYGMMPKRRVK